MKKINNEKPNVPTRKTSERVGRLLSETELRKGKKYVSKPNKISELTMKKITI
jgi:hypothetical protein